MRTVVTTMDTIKLTDKVDQLYTNRLITLKKNGRAVHVTDRRVTALCCVTDRGSRTSIRVHVKLRPKRSEPPLLTSS